MKNTIKQAVASLGLCLGLLTGAASAEVPRTIPGPQALTVERGGALAAEGCNRALHMRITDWALRDEHAGEAPPPGHRWLVLSLEVENIMPADLIFDLDYPEEVLIGSLERQGYLLVNGERVYRRARMSGDSDAIIDSFVLGRIGAMISGSLVYPVPDAGIESLSLRYYHDDYAALEVPLMAGESRKPEADREAAQQVEANDLMEVGVQGFDLHERWEGHAAPPGMIWLVVDLRGRGKWVAMADALALDRDADPSADIELPRVMEYVEGRGLLQAVIDTTHGYVRDSELGSLPDNPAWLPDAWAGGMAVFAIPEDAEGIELVAYFPEFRATGITPDIRPSMRFRLRDGTTSAASVESLALIEDEPTPVTIHALGALDAFSEYRAEEGETLVLVEASMTNLSGTGGMMTVTDRFRLRAPQGELVAAYQRGPVELVEPFWLPADDEPRHFMLLYRLDALADDLEFEYGGVSVNESLRLALDQ
ncbi:hypothetical protein [Billgrantia montanilacus]|uniref:DUF4352 domain-containing protein n=1 Tax=Billgrantia montanilacus TaxID=2282305 RepID=A0A368TX08_9GAMM|nr:hypothetical protein [Halomonas montanilacus]RCV87623.1 hypothetical protein DU505_16305 [Halomonas montanilacus]